jgi:hypothetical protein
MSDCGVFTRRLAIEEEVMTDTSAADVAGGGARRHADADALMSCLTAAATAATSPFTYFPSLNWRLATVSTPLA